jgi:dTDP-glucose 4,6-dehydratase
VLVTNCSNNYGPIQFPDKLIPLMIIKALHGEPLPVYGDGGNVRDWLFVDDHARALRRVFEAGVPGQTYAIGGNAERTNLAIVRAICAVLDRLAPRTTGARMPTCISSCRTAPATTAATRSTPTHIRTTLGWEPQHALEDGIEATVRWYIDHPGWWQDILASHRATDRLGLGQT